jgi:anti-sigma factor (TIGR02949 family)
MNEHKHPQQNCQDWLTSLGEYVDGELPPELCAEIERHMNDCPDCTIVVNTLKKTVELYHTDDQPNLPQDVRARLYTRLHMEDYLTPQDEKQNPK